MSGHFKETLRKQMFNKRNLFPQHDAEVSSDIICRRLGIFMDYRNAKNIMLYLPINSEVNTIPIIQMCQEDDKKILIPTIQNDEITACEFKGFETLEKGKFKVLEPCDKTPFPPAKIDLICVPGLAFNTGRYRLGYGGGYYDRFLPMLREDCFKVGIAYDFQVTNLLPIEPHDFKLDMVITEVQFIGERPI